MANPIARVLSRGPSADSEPTSAGKWLVAASVMIGTFLSVMDATVVNVAMPHMMGSFGQDLLTITWVSTAYSIAEIIMITMSAWMTTLLGRKRLFLASMILFTVGSVLAGTSKTLTQMIFYRVLQGIGGGSLMPCSQAIARETFPPAEQGMAMAIYSMGVVLAPAIGPVIGGWLVDNYGWQWVFYINVPFCIVGLMMVSTFVHDPAYLKRGVARIDWTGIGLLTVGLTMMQVVLERGEEVDWFSNHWIVARRGYRLGRAGGAGGVGTLHRRTGDKPPLVSQRAAKRRLESRDGGRLCAFWIEFPAAAIYRDLTQLPGVPSGHGADAPRGRNAADDASGRTPLQSRKSTNTDSHRHSCFSAWLPAAQSLHAYGQLRQLSADPRHHWNRYGRFDGDDEHGLTEHRGTLSNDRSVEPLHSVAARFRQYRVCNAGDHAIAPLTGSSLGVGWCSKWYESAVSINRRTVSKRSQRLRSRRYADPAIGPRDVQPDCQQSGDDDGLQRLFLADGGDAGCRAALLVPIAQNRRAT